MARGYKGDKGCLSSSGYKGGIELGQSVSLLIWITRMLIVCYRMEELVILYYRNVTILRSQAREYTQRTGCLNRVEDQILWGQLFLDELHREHMGWTTTQKQEWGLFMLECLLHNTATMQRTECHRCSQGTELETAKLAPEHPSMWTLLGSPNEEILEVVEQVYRGELSVVPSVLPCQWQDWCMGELCQELARHMARAGLQSKVGLARTAARGQKCFHSCFISQVCSPSSKCQGTEVAKWLKEDTPVGLSEARRHSPSRGRYRSRQCQSPSPQCPSRCQSSSPSPPQSCPTTEWFNCSMKGLNLYTRPHQSRSRVQWSDAPTLTEKPKKQVRFEEERGPGRWPHIVPGPNPLLGGGPGWRVGWCSRPCAWGILAATSLWGSQVLPHPHRRSQA